MYLLPKSPYAKKMYQDAIIEVMLVTETSSGMHYYAILQSISKDVFTSSTYPHYKDKVLYQHPSCDMHLACGIDYLLWMHHSLLIARFYLIDRDDNESHLARLPLLINLE